MPYLCSRILRFNWAFYPITIAQDNETVVHSTDISWRDFISSYPIGQEAKEDAADSQDRDECA